MPRYRSSGPAASRSALTPAVEWGAGIRHALLHTLPGRAIVLGLLIKLGLAPLRLVLGVTPAFLSVVDTVAGIAIAAGLAWFVFRLLVLAKRRLLWRVRRKLILSYIFIGFVPAILIGAFFVLCGLLLFYNFSSYLVQTQRRGSSPRVPPSRFSAPARAKRRRSCSASRRTAPRNPRACRSPSCPSDGPVARDRRRPANRTFHLRLDPFRIPAVEFRMPPFEFQIPKSRFQIRSPRARGHTSIRRRPYPPGSDATVSAA
ncbi:MAG: hypothetical protein DMF97_12045 [Acidobacteria bacterium]|nr:MAG: hypothetical protein DMF97_12045 [Acidobacteriota bacterium]